MRGLIFDCDGVLANTEAIICEASIRMFREMYDVEMAPEEFEPFVGTGEARYTQGPAENRGISIDLDAAMARRQELFMEILHEGKNVGFPGVKELIEAALDSGQWLLGVGTSSGREKSRASIIAAGLPIDRFTSYACGDDVVNKKPHPDIFLKSAEGLGLPPERCVGIEDSPSGVTAVKAAGMACIAVTNSFPRDRIKHADIVVDSLEEVTLAMLVRLVDRAA